MDLLDMPLLYSGSCGGYRFAWLSAENLFLKAQCNGIACVASSALGSTKRPAKRIHLMYKIMPVRD